MKEEQQVIKIGKVKYLLMNDVMTRGGLREKDMALRKMGCIRQGVKEVNPAGWFETGYVVMNYYVPINKIEQFTKLVN